MSIVTNLLAWPDALLPENTPGRSRPGVALLRWRYLPVCTVGWHCVAGSSGAPLNTMLELWEVSHGWPQARVISGILLYL